MEVSNKVSGVTYERNVARITMRAVPDRPGVVAHVFEPLTDAGISVDTIVQNASVEKLTDMTFTVAPGDLTEALRVVEAVKAELGAAQVVSEPDLGTVSVVGTGMASAPGFAARMFKTLHEASINIDMISTSDIRITCVIASAQVGDAVRALHDAFELDRED